MRFDGDAVRTVTVTLLCTVAQLREAQPEALELIERRAPGHTPAEIAAEFERLDCRGWQEWPYTAGGVLRILNHYCLRHRENGLRACGHFSARELADTLGVSMNTVWSSGNWACCSARMPRSRRAGINSCISSRTRRLSQTF